MRRRVVIVVGNHRAVRRASRWDVHFGMSILGCPKGVVMSASAVLNAMTMRASSRRRHQASGGGGGARTKHRLLRANDPLPSDELTRIGR